MNVLKKISVIFLFSTLLISFSSAVMSFDFIVPDTGQDLCYDWDDIIECPDEGEDFYGQDAHYTINPPDLTDNEDGTITDNLTGLMWEQKTKENEPNLYTYNEAITYCDELVLGEQNDWRMSTRKEYSTILNYGRVSPALDENYFPYSTANEVSYWTISEYHDDPNQVWKILMSFGLIYEGPKTPDLHKVQCVRGDSEPAASYTDNGNGTVTDNVTGLMWEQKTNDGGSRDKDDTYIWKDALSYCENLILSSYYDWRIPTPKELERLIDLGSSSPAIDTTYFPNTNNGFYWTGTTCSGCHKKVAFAMDFSDGELFKGNKEVDYELYVRCVRTSDAADTTTTTSPVASTTTTTVSSQGCPAGEIYGEDSDEAQLLRSFRDTILNKTPEGREITRLYYAWSPVIVEALEKDKKFKEEMKAVVDEMLLIIEPR